MNDSFVAPTVDWLYLAPILVVLGAGVVGVLIEAFVPARVRRTTQVVLALLATAAAFALVVVLWRDPAVQGADGAPYGVRVLGGSMVIDPFGLAIQGIVVLLAFLAILVIADKTSTGQDAFAPSAAAVPGSPYEDLTRRKGLEQTEVYPLVLFAVGGMMIFPATGNLLVMFVALEVLSLPLYVLSAMARRRRLLSQEASFKYFLLGAFASALFVFGVALVYGFAGSVDLVEVYQSLANPAGPLASMPGLVVVGVLLVLAGLLFKIGAAPFHAWTPDVYQGAPTPITGFMAACTKAAAFGALLRVLYVVSLGLAQSSPTAREDLFVALWIVTLLTMVVGTVVGAVQTDVKRLLAYSSIAHAGFILVGVVGFSQLSLRATVFYLLVYGLATVGAFAVVTLVRETAPVRGRVPAAVGAGAAGTDAADNATDGAAEQPVAVLGEATHLAQWAGLGRRSPWLAGVFSLFLLSMAGIPLTAGFVAKFTAFGAAVAGPDGQGGGSTWVLAVVGVLASAVAVFFYVRIIVLMFFTAPSGGPADGSDDDDRAVDGPGVTVVRSTGPTTIAIAVCALGVLLLGVFPSPVLDLAAEAVKFVP
ncbi:NADH-quinone oxidoreductase subunit N [Cellulosimicrobium cellulans]|uniref:NADH-quinone oxidoreductase subunit N n=1 Tax=Cellulosimicrobium cellulans TaxID=1710 RepID=A0A1Y0HVU9_CELCE|nr:NADH-quinone oxidoreductase subunit NuoN [Cellulosimicrobium cellulans]ARU52271.1 NADH-quinone oxidoreductase subunit N [Cellulosimicrobium cellulans]MBM7818872.1 NADH-quinone oxidoreductase subunit N [Cellulosimicrobium cellulans]